MGLYIHSLQPTNTVGVKLVMKEKDGVYLENYFYINEMVPAPGKRLGQKSCDEEFLKIVNIYWRSKTVTVRRCRKVIKLYHLISLRYTAMDLAWRMRCVI